MFEYDADISACLSSSKKGVAYCVADRELCLFLRPPSPLYKLIKAMDSLTNSIINAFVESHSAYF